MYDIEILHNVFKNTLEKSGRCKYVISNYCMEDKVVFILKQTKHPIIHHLLKKNRIRNPKL